MIEKIFQYKFFGCKIETNFPIDFLTRVTTKCPPDLKVSCKADTIKLPNIDPLTSLVSDKLVYYKDGYENLFRISNDYIEIIPNGTNFSNLGLSLVGIPIGYYFFLNKLQVLHGSAVSIDNKAVCFVGQSSVGKSALSVSLIDEKVKFVSEDLLVLENNFRIRKNVNWVKLSSELTSVYREKLEASFKIFKDKRKRFICHVKEDLVQNQESRVSLCYFPIWGEKLEIREMNIKENFSFLFTNSYKQKEYDLTNVDYKKSLEKISSFINNTKCFVYQRKKELKKLEDNNSHLLDHICKNI